MCIRDRSKRLSVMLALLFAVCMVFGACGKSSATTSQMCIRDSARIGQIEQANPHDMLEIEGSDGVSAIRWEDVLAVYAVKVTTEDVYKRQKKNWRKRKLNEKKNKPDAAALRDAKRGHKARIGYCLLYTSRCV